jgi:hypothetical protein
MAKSWLPKTTYPHFPNAAAEMVAKPSTLSIGKRLIRYLSKKMQYNGEYRVCKLSGAW